MHKKIQGATTILVINIQCVIVSNVYELTQGQITMAAQVSGLVLAVTMSPWIQSSPSCYDSGDQESMAIIFSIQVPSADSLAGTKNA